MKFFEKYPQLQQKEFLTQILTDTVFSTMSLEDQQVEKSKVEKMVTTLLRDEESKGGQFFSDKSL